MNKLATLFPSDPARSYIAPLFWQHGESNDVLREEIRRMHAAGIDAFILESRPFPDFLGPRWWATLDIILAEAKECGMKMWVFDDKGYPTGFANGAIKDHFPHMRKQFLRYHFIEAAGPRSGASFLLKNWFSGDETLMAVVAVRRADNESRLDGETLVDVTAQVHDGVLYWDVPEGFWRVYLFIRTTSGGEDWTKDYLDPINPDAVRVLLDTVYEPHFQHYGADFGRTFAGFFSDEPRFGNAATYEARLGYFPGMVLPFSPLLKQRLDAAWGADFARVLPALWYDAGAVSAKARFTYMNEVSRMYGKCFSQQIGDWCRAHKVQYIGHIVEDNGAHARLGYGPGHFFRALQGQDVSGLDVVYQIWPDYRDGHLYTAFGYLDATFFYWGIAKLASSAAHLDPSKRGVTMCELFGAYGWQFGLKMMKWLTDHLCVRGINMLVPHAFSPKDFPDPDCPPHFYARGHNPQWRCFNVWSQYATRLVRLLSGGRHIASAAVLYHAEAEWAGAYEPFERVVATLAKQQVDCDVLAIDTLINPALARLADGRLWINGESFPAIIVPYAEFLPAAALQRLAAAAAGGVHVVFISDFPKAAVDDTATGAQALTALRNNPQVTLCTHANLVKTLRKWGLNEVKTTTAQPDLGVYHYQRNGHDLFFITNASIRHAVETKVLLRGQTQAPAGYEAMHDRILRMPHKITKDGVRLNLHLEPFGAILLVFPGGELLMEVAKAKAPAKVSGLHRLELTGPWRVATATAEEYPAFKSAPAVTGLGNTAQPNVLPKFSGTLRYETAFDLQAAPPAKTQAWLDLGELYEIVEVRLNDKEFGACICPPYRFEITGCLKPGRNEIRIDVTNTLAKALGDNAYDRAMPQDPSGLFGPVQVEF